MNSNNNIVLFKEQVDKTTWVPSSTLSQELNLLAEQIISAQDPNSITIAVLTDGLNDTQKISDAAQALAFLSKRVHIDLAVSLGGHSNELNTNETLLQQIMTANTYLNPVLERFEHSIHMLGCQEELLLGTPESYGINGIYNKFNEHDFLFENGMVDIDKIRYIILDHSKETPISALKTYLDQSNNATPIVIIANQPLDTSSVNDLTSFISSSEYNNEVLCIISPASNRNDDQIYQYNVEILYGIDQEGPIGNIPVISAPAINQFPNSKATFSIFVISLGTQSANEQFNKRKSIIPFFYGEIPDNTEIIYLDQPQNKYHYIQHQLGDLYFYDIIEPDFTSTTKWFLQGSDLTIKLERKEVPEMELANYVTPYLIPANKFPYEDSEIIRANEDETGKWVINLTNIQQDYHLLAPVLIN